MADLYNINNYASSSSTPPPQEPDEISLFLQQILLRSSSANSSSFTRHHSFPAVSDHLLTENQEAVAVSGTGQIHVPEPGSALNSSSGCGFTVANVSSSSVGNLDNEPDEYEYESEDGVEALVEETVPKQTSSRSSSKRSRAAEVHNQSEKRRRSRINEKMKALQNLIPNSNKTDKASMLDEAIEYLKQLQLQVQMLTMRNGLSLYPICLPGMLQHNQIFDTDDKIRSTNISRCISMDQNISANALIKPQDNFVKRAPLTDFSAMISSKPLFKVEYSSQQNHFGPLDLCKEKALPCDSPNEDYPEMMSSIGHKAISSIPYETRKSRLNESTIEACLAEGDHLLSNLVNNPMFSSQLNM